MTAYNYAENLKPVKFTNSAPEHKEWTAHVQLLNEWTSRDRQLRDIIGYARSGEHFPKDMHVDLVNQYIAHVVEEISNSKLDKEEIWFTHTYPVFTSAEDYAMHSAIIRSTLRDEIKGTIKAIANSIRQNDNE